MTPNQIGALLMMGSMACFTLNDTLIKLTAGAVPLFQLIFLRGLLTTSMILAARGRMGKMPLRFGRRDWGFVGLRAVAEVASAYFFLSALVHMPLANVSAILQVLPLSITLTSAVLLREPVGWKRMSAIVVGFVGVLMIVKPGAEGFNIWSVYALLAVACVTVRDLATRQISSAVPAMSVTLVTAVVITGAAGLGSLTEVWAPITRELGSLIVGAAVFVLGGYFFSINAMRAGDVSFVASFRYTGLIWALMLGWLVFDHWPSTLTLAGGAIVVATGIFTLYRERKLSRA
ncbi:S-adenosylmethionine uptake transporter [Sulfitobacter brevis]|uniref:S-adenosylmethionine uptake transporter n=1 Tax=Sulfitobacter brevis TaxID=74348 RepID=A0A1I2GH96_9RHOB|nr:DMT family transporter [Sulfitobacter brevis]SFF16011.1 S-adenosylmethionine uptake transporter [Sulfitobacter brevis]